MRAAVELVGGELSSGQAETQLQAAEPNAGGVLGTSGPGGVGACIQEPFTTASHHQQLQPQPLAPAVPALAPDAAAPGCASVACGWLHAYLPNCGTGFVYCNGRQLEPCSPDGLLHLQVGALGLQLAAVTPLQAGELAALAARDDSLRLLAWRAAHAWNTPGQPGFGVLELNGGWRVCSLQQLQAVVAGGGPPLARQASAPPTYPPWAWPAVGGSKHAPPAVQQPSCSASASNSSTAIFSAASAVGGTPGGCNVRRTRAAAQRQDGEEVTSAPAAKRRRRSRTDGVAAEPAAPAAPAVLPQFSEGEVALLQSLLGTPKTRRCDEGACPSVSFSPHEVQHVAQ